MKTRTGLMAIGLMALVSGVQAANPPASLVMIPPQINYQGRLVTPANSAYSDATHTIDLSLYPTASGGAKLWSERYAVQTRDGYFSVNLGSGGTALLASNLPIWQVLWKTDGASPDTFFMALTVRTDQTGNPVASPAEATPRQQFLSAPFAYRAHQSVYASKADGLFSAAQGVQTPSLSSTTNEISVEAPVRVKESASVYANRVEGHGASPELALLSSGGPLFLGVDLSRGFVSDHASTINIGAQPRSGFLPITGTDIRLDGRTVDIGTPTFTFNNKPMFVQKSVTVAASTSGAGTFVPHGINTTDYDVVSVGWYYDQPSPRVTGVLLIAFFGGPPTGASVFFSGTPASGSVTVVFLGIRKGLTQNL
jgi:hypothetical protein